MKKKIFVAVLFLGIIAAVGAAKFKDKGPEALAVETAPVATTTIVQTVTATGRIQPKTQVSISADVSGKILSLGVEEGEWVEKGTLLVELERRRYVASVELSEANVRAITSNSRLAKENMTKAEKDHERSKGLFDNDLVSQAALDATYAAAQAGKARYAAALDEVAQARASLKQAVDELDKTRIYSPLSGTVSKLNKEVGEIALGSQFQKDVIMEIANLEGMEAVVDVDENDIVQVALADIATIEVDALPGVELKGEVTEIASSAKLSATGTSSQKTEFEVRVAVSVSNSSLRPGMTASSEVVTETKTDVLGVPIQCVAVRTLKQLKDNAAEGLKDELDEIEADEDGFVELVFVIADGTAQVRQVTTGIQSDTKIEILSGIEAGDQVVIGNFRAISKDLQHGTEVNATEKGAKKTDKTLIAHK